jgi:hypothetical protein
MARCRGLGPGDGKTQVSDLEDAMAERDRAYVDLANALGRMAPARDGAGVDHIDARDRAILRAVAANLAGSAGQTGWPAAGTNPGMFPDVVSAMLVAVAADEKVERVAGT